mmetsp:Transcript_153947/g.492146  ORF Transcript_153947/g.492146 Transcript_153947/m.492146 type:complete len:440 (+) Transcript_153947:49-1368(+)
MNLLLAAPLDDAQIREVQSSYPEFTGAVPPEAKFWSEADLHLFCGSGGQLRPREGVSAGSRCGGDERFASCALLTRLRQRLAEARVDEAPAEYRSVCRHLRQRASDLTCLPGVAECAQVERHRVVPRGVLRSPLLVERVRMWVGRRWNSAFWRREFGAVSWKCRTRAPHFESDAALAGSLQEVCEAGEYVDYMRVLQHEDPRCDEENGLAFPRVIFNDWPIFYLGAAQLFEGSWRDLPPPGLIDHTLRWLKRWSGMCSDMPHLEQFARLHRITLAAPGAFTRLHRENFGAHAWFTQIEGSRLFFLFPPQGRHLYEESGRGLDPETVHDYAEKASPVDVFFPSQKRHPLFREAKAKVALLNPGECLVVPSGWWHASVALESSVTLHRVFWNVANRGGIVDALRDIVSCEHQSGDLHERLNRCLDDFYDVVMDDNDPEDSE